MSSNELAVVSTVDQQTGNGRNGRRLRSVVERAMSDAAKRRIEELVDARARNLKDYLKETEEQVLQQAGFLEPQNAAAIAKLEGDKSLLKLRQDSVSAERDSEKNVLQRVLLEDRDLKINRLERMKDRVRRAYQEQLSELERSTSAKFEQQEQDLGVQMNALVIEIDRLKKEDQQRQAMQKAALRQAFSQMGQQIGDARCLAVEKLYTEVVVSTDASECLQQLPDATLFRDRLPPEKLFMAFGPMLGALPAPEGKVTCSKCGSNDVVMNVDQPYCKKCGTRDVFAKQVASVVRMPSLREIVQEAANGNGFGTTLDATPAVVTGESEQNG